MADIILFTPRSKRNADRNLADFILCRTRLSAFGCVDQFPQDVWEVDLALKGKNHKDRLIYSNWPTSRNKAKGAKGKVMMTEPFKSFAKCYLSYQQGVRPSKSIGGRLSCLRALEWALVESTGNSDPTQCNPDTLNRAAQLLYERHGEQSAYRNGQQLQMLSEFLNAHGLTQTAFIWENPIRRLPSQEGRVGEEFDRRREKKLPSPAALTALAKCFTLAEDTADVLVTSACAIMCGAPDRVNEVTGMRVDCEAPSSAWGAKNETYGLRWWPSKDAAPMIKWIVNSMVSVVKLALERIRRHTEQAREIARWYEKNPTKIYLPEFLEHLRTRDRLSMKEVAEIVYADPLDQTNTPRAWCERHGVGVSIDGRRGTAAFSDVERAILRMLPKGFPVADSARGLMYTEALFLVRRNQMASHRTTYRCAIDLLEQGDIYQRLGSRSQTGMRSIFDKFGFTEDDGTSIRVTTHQFRHYLNTLAQAGGLSELDIAKWSGRKDIRQNERYNHVSDHDLLASVEEKFGEIRMFGPERRNSLKNYTLVPRNEFGQLTLETAHTTELGYCEHLFVESPCPNHADCMNCAEHFIIKGEDLVKEANIRALRDETEWLYALALKAKARGEAGVEAWIKYHSDLLDKLRDVCGILDDDGVPPGSVIKLAGTTVSQIEVAMQRRIERGTEQSASSSLTLRIEAPRRFNSP